jgi:hypothetical protein
MWHVTFEPYSGEEDARQFTKCIEGTTEPPMGVCLVCAQERRIEELEKFIIRLGYNADMTPQESREPGQLMWRARFVDERRACR